MKDFKHDLLKSMLPEMILTEASAGPIHGYGLIRTIRRRESVYFGPSTIYPILTQLEKEGYITSQWDMAQERPRKLYTITQKGRTYLSGVAVTVKLIVHKEPVMMN